MKQQWKLFIALLLLATNAIANQPEVKGKLVYGDKTYELKHVLVWRSLTEEATPDPMMWVYLTDVEVPAEIAGDPYNEKLWETVKASKLHGVLLDINATTQPPELNNFSGHVLVPPTGESGSTPSTGNSGGDVQFWKKLEVSDKNVSGSLLFKQEASDFFKMPAWSVDVAFAAAVSGTAVTAEFLEGEAAQKSAPVDAFLKMDTALRTSFDAAKPHMTQTRIAEMESMAKFLGPEGFKQMLKEGQANTPGGEAMRKSITKVVLSGDSATIFFQDGVKEPMSRQDGIWKSGK